MRRLEARRDAERVAQLLDDALDVEEIDLARAARPVLGAGVAGPRDRDARAFRRARLNRAPISNSRDVAPAVTRLCATASTRPGSSDGRSVSNFADSGFAIATPGAADPSAGERSAAAFASMNAERHRLGQPGGRQHAAHEPIARRCADPAAAPAAVTTGNVGSSWSKP